jgi:mono/diheme cytochrome c family protein
MTVHLTPTNNLEQRTKGNTRPLQVFLLCAAMLVLPGICPAQAKSPQKQPARQPDAQAGKETYQRYCASCHGESAKGDGPAATALHPPPTDLTTLTKRHEGKFPSGYVGALVKFGRSLAAHGSLDMPVWGAKLKALDPDHDPTGQQHVDDLVAYLESLQVK